MLSMTQDLFSFFLSLALCPVLVSPTPQTLPRGSGLFSQPSPSGFPYTAMVSLRWIFSRLQSSYGTVCPSHKAQSLGNCGPPGIKHCPTPGDWRGAEGAPQVWGRFGDGGLSEL